MNTINDEPAHYVRDDFDGRSEPFGYWRKFLKCSGGVVISGHGRNAEEAIQKAETKRLKVEMFLRQPDIVQLRELAKKDDVPMSDVSKMLKLITKILDRQLRTTSKI
jgi:hypothetical protein